MLLDAVTKQPNENFSITIPCEDELAENESITACTITVRRLKDGLDVSSTMLSGSTQITVATSEVSRVITGGETGEFYRAQFAITTSAGSHLEYELDIAVVEE